MGEIPCHHAQRKPTACGSHHRRPLAAKAEQRRQALHHLQGSDVIAETMERCISAWSWHPGRFTSTCESATAHRWNARLMRCVALVWDCLKRSGRGLFCETAGWNLLLYSSASWLQQQRPGDVAELHLLRSFACLPGDSEINDCKKLLGFVESKIDTP